MNELNDHIKALDAEAARLITIESNLQEHPLAQKDISESAARLIKISNDLRKIRDAAVTPALQICEPMVGERFTIY